MKQHERAREMLETALNMETRGQAFYTEAVERCENPLGRAMFQKLLDDEVAHTSRIERIFKLAQAGADWSAEAEAIDADPADLVQFFGRLVKSMRQPTIAHATDLQALDLGLDFEKRAVELYEGALANAREGFERRFLERMVAEERSHVAALTELRSLLADPQAWFKAHEELVSDG